MNTQDISGVSEGIKESISADIESKLNEEQITPSCSIGISISNSPDLDALGFTELHIQDAMVEVTRYLLVNNCNLIYGGDLRKGGFTYLFSELAKQYSSPQNYDAFRVTNYFAWPIHLNLTRLDDSEFKANNIRIVKLPPPSDITVNTKQFIAPDELNNKIIWAKSLSYMRGEIVHNSNARILMGGQVTNYMGKMPGLLEEFIVSVKANQPVYLCGAFGGITKSIINVLINKKDSVLSEAYQLSNTNYQEFYHFWNNQELATINYAQISKDMSEWGISNLCKLNGLSEEENIRLFETPHIQEMTFLILKGLKKLGLV